LTTLGVLTSRPIAFYFVVLYGAVWFAFDRSTLNWGGFATLATWIMTLIIQRAEHRDTQAIHAKLDDLLLSPDTARSELSQVDRLQPEEIERVRADAHSGAGLAPRP
jgi:low affinity Fe/Cu permease